MKIKLWSCVLVFILLVGCSSTSSVESDALTMLTNYKKAQYELSYNQIADGNYDKLTSDGEKANANLQVIKGINEKVKPFLTEKEYEIFLKNRTSQLTLDAVINQKYDIKVEKLELNETTLENNNQSIVGHYSMVLKLISISDKSEKLITKNGQLTLIKENDSWKIDRDWDGDLTEKDVK
ncbi:hypothetical protein ABE354_22000 [Brevibacillus laterosporus]|uniref:hypothetical protein n=1 Tax=Brevibacillus laterosporus TaxID=1465 RepID=UPI003D22CB14